MINCNKCKGRVFVDFTFTDNQDYEVFCIMCGRRWFVAKSNPLYSQVEEYVGRVLSG